MVKYAVLLKSADERNVVSTVTCKLQNSELNVIVTDYGSRLIVRCMLCI